MMTSHANNIDDNVKQDKRMYRNRKNPAYI